MNQGMSTPTHHEGVVPTAFMVTPPSTGKPSPLATLWSTPFATKATDVTETNGTNSVFKRASSLPAAKFGLAVSDQGQSTPPVASYAIVEQGPGAEDTDSEDSASNWADENAPDGNVEASDSEVMSVHGSKNHAGDKANGVKKGSKRARADSCSAMADGVVKKKRRRVRTTALQRQAPTARTELPLGNGELANFTATIFIIMLGQNCHQFHAHESVLIRSPKLYEEVQKAKASKRSTKRNFIPLMEHNPVAFEQMLQYLYKDKFQLNKTKSTAVARIAEIHELFSLAKHYLLPGLQKQIVKMFSSSSLLSKITTTMFFDWAEDMYYEELDHQNGPFKTYFARVAPTLMGSLEAGVFEDLCRMTKMGGGFAEELLKASHQALLTHTFVKQEAGADDVAMDGTGTGEGQSLFVH